MVAEKVNIFVPCPHCYGQTPIAAEIEKKKVSTPEGMIDEVIYRQQNVECVNCNKLFEVCNFRGSFSLRALIV